MPTLGWILETAEERFYERGGDGMASHVPAKVKCPICDAEFDDLLALSWHVSDLHPLERPLLLIGGAAIPSSAVFSVQPDPAVIAFANTTTIRATCNGRAINAPAPEDLAARLGSERRAVF